MIPIRDNAHVAEGQGLLISQFKDKAVIKGFVTACTLRLQQIENSFWDLINDIQLNNHPLPGGPWSILDQIGAIVEVARNGLDDPAYLALIKLKAKVNRSRGTPEDVLQLGVLMTALQPPVYLEMPIAVFYLGVRNISPTAYAQLVALIMQARAASVYGLLVYSTWAPGNDLIWGSRYDATAGQGGLGSRYDATKGGLLSAALPM
jgi:hypothetical protein